MSDSRVIQKVGISSTVFWNKNDEPGNWSESSLWKSMTCSATADTFFATLYT
jgi:hypothetical protein